MRKKLLVQQMNQLQARIKHLEECIKTQDLLLEGYQNREAAVIGTLQKLQAESEARMAEAEAKAHQIEETAKQKSARLLAQTEATVAEYRDTIDNYNAALESLAKEASETAEQFASLVRKKKLTEESLVLETEGLSAMPHQPSVDLPDPQGDPARLIHNIYRLQNRILPEDVQQTVYENNASDAEEPMHESESLPSAVEAETEAEDAIERSIDSVMEEDVSLHTVSTVLDTLGSVIEESQELTLDDLLDEIIKSGEQYHG